MSAVLMHGLSSAVASTISRALSRDFLWLPDISAITKGGNFLLSHFSIKLISLKNFPFYSLKSDIR